MDRSTVDNLINVKIINEIFYILFFYTKAQKSSTYFYIYSIQMSKFHQKCLIYI